MTPLISVCIPCHNNALHVAEAVQSALAQTHPSIEVVVVDDGSTDDSVEVLRGFGDRITLEAGPNRGACAARNRALALSHGEYINFLDADDRLLPRKIETQLPFLINDEADLVFCEGYLFAEGEGLNSHPLSFPDPSGVDPFVYLIKRGVSTEGPLHRRDTLDRVGGFREKVKRGQERDLHMRLGACGVRLHWIDEVLFEHRNHPAPRISNTPGSPDTFLKVLLELSEITSAPPYDLTAERRQAMADALFQYSIYVFRNGVETTAAEGFARARQLSPKPQYQERAIYRAIVSITGPLAAERFLKVGRQLKNRMLRNAAS